MHAVRCASLCVATQQVWSISRICCRLCCLITLTFCAGCQGAMQTTAVSWPPVKQGCALRDIERDAELGRDEGLDSGKLRRLDQLELPREAGVGDDTDDGVDACAAEQSETRRSGSVSTLMKDNLVHEFRRPEMKHAQCKHSDGDCCRPCPHRIQAWLIGERATRVYVPLLPQGILFLVNRSRVNE